MSELTEYVERQDDQVANAISAALSGLLPAIATAVGEAPDLKKDFDPWAERCHRTASAMVTTVIGVVGEQTRLYASRARLMSGFDLSDKDKKRKIVTGIVLQVFTHKGAGVMVTQNPYTPEDERLGADEAVELAVAAVKEGDSNTFKGDFEGQTPGELGAKGIERFWLGRRSTEDGVLAYNSAKSAVGHMARIFKEIGESKKSGKPIKLCRYVEAVKSWEADLLTVEGGLDEIEVHANSDNEFEDYDDLEPEDDELDAADRSFPTTEQQFKKWASERGIKTPQLTEAKEQTGIKKRLSLMDEEEFANICEALLANA